MRADVCLDADDITAFLHAQLDPDSVRTLEAHVVTCGDCRQLLSALAESRGSAVPAADADSRAFTYPLAHESDPELAISASVGRYRVQNKLGAGGMGVVYAAHDPALNRRVALKILRTAGRSPDQQQLLHDRLHQEAQAMAQLAHPNVVTVHDVGTVGERIFIAMELVEGQTLGAWLAASPRGWREILAKLLPAGEGLAAAHAAGMVHRDFKPENVFIGKDGRARVGDFGLARGFTHGDASPEQAPAGAEAEGARTVTGALVGTPFYMSPEQFLGRTLDARTDQFSFCVTLYAAIAGQHPFAGDNVESLAHAVTHGTLRPPPRPDPLPRWLRKVLLRGLSVSPDKRYPSMRELLAALARDPRRRLLYAVAAAVPVLTLVAAVALASRTNTGAAHLCKGAEDKWRGVWDAGRAAEVEKAFLATGKPYAAASFASVKQTLDDYERRWAQAHADACEATRVRGEQSEEMLDRRMLCLDAHLRTARALTAGFAAADDTVVERALPALGLLGEIASCSDVQALSSQVPVPADPVRRARVAELRSELAELEVVLIGEQKQAQHQRMLELVEAAHATKYRPLEAEALLQQANYDAEIGDAKAASEALEQAIWAAEAGHVDELAARAWIKLMKERGEGLGKYQEALALAPRVTAIIERVGGDEKLTAELALANATLLGSFSHIPEAKVEAAKALALLEKRFGSEHEAVAEAFDQLAYLARLEGRPKDALGFYQRELTILQKRHGESHPEVGRVLQEMANAYAQDNRHDEAISAFQKAQAIFDASLAPNNPRHAVLAHNFALVYQNIGDYEKSLALHKRAVDLGSKAFGREHPSYAMFLASYGWCLIALGRADEAIAALKEALALLEKLLGPEHGRIATSLEHLGEALYDAHRYDEARADLLRAIAIFEKNFGPEHMDLSPMLLLLGMVDLKLKAPARALPSLERALRLGTTGDPGVYAEIQWALARALVESGKDPGRGMKLARMAHEEFKQDKREKENLAELEAWLAQRRARP